MSKLEAMAEQPPKDVMNNVCCLGIRLPNGERVERRFYADTTLEVNFFQFVSITM